jgi:hypothetical protein
MPHATIKLIPGIDNNETPALNQAAFNKSQLVRFKPDRNGMGLIEKIGGWLQYSTATFTGISQLWAWEDLASVKRLAVGDTTGLYYLQYSRINYKTNITPQQQSDNTVFGVANAVSSFVAGSTNTVSTTTPVSNGMAMVFATTGTLPTGIIAGTVYYAANTSYSAGTWTFQISTLPSLTPIISLGTTGSGSSTFTFQIAVWPSGSNIITIYDTGVGVANVTFASSIVTVGTDSTGLNAATSPANGTPVKFYGASVPAGITPGTTYYVVYLTSTTYSLSSSSSSVVPVSFSSGSGKQFIPNQIQAGYNVNFLTPIVFSNLILNGTYTVYSTTSTGIYSIYQIQVGATAASTYTGSLISFVLTNGTSTVTVNETNQPYINGTTVTFLWPTVSNGVTIYGNYIVTNATTNSYQIVASTAATATTTIYMNTLSNGNAYVHFQYTYNLPSPYAASGYGTGGYGVGGYGVGVVGANSNIPGNNITSTDWSITNFGEVLCASPDGGAIYYWSPTQNTPNAYLLANAPQANDGIFVAMPARQLVAYGSTVTGIQDPLLVRWSDVGDLTTWTPTPTNQAGSYRIPEGSAIIGAIQGPQQGLIWTDISLWAMQYVGPQAVYGFNKISDGSGAISKKCMGVINGVVYWMSQKKFMRLSGGGPETLQCQIWDQVFQNLNQNALTQIRCATNSVFNEVIWYYPTAGSPVNNAYVKYNIVTNSWDYGALDRTSWVDQSVLGMPIGSSSSGIIYQHEMGYDADTVPMVSSFQTGYIQLNEADNLVFVDQVWPDFQWQTLNGSTTSATLYLTFYGANYPGDTPTVYGPYQFTQGTEYINVRIRNRLLSIGVSTADANGNAVANTFYRIGAMRYRYQLDGRF